MPNENHDLETHMYLSFYFDFHSAVIHEITGKFVHEKLSLDYLTTEVS